MTERTVSVVLLLGALAHEELELKKLGAFAQAEGIRTAITRLLRLSDEAKTAPNGANSATHSEPKQ